MDTMTTEPKRKRIERSPELKARVLAECERPGASVAQVALANGVNANPAMWDLCGHGPS
jgi:transposase